MAYLDKKQKFRKNLIEQYRKILREDQRNLREAVDSCRDHIVIKIGYSSVCDICAKDLGWYCVDSPNKYCEYDESSGWIDCKHCGQPSIRK